MGLASATSPSVVPADSSASPLRPTANRTGERPAAGTWRRARPWELHCPSRPCPALAPGHTSTPASVPMADFHDLHSATARHPADPRLGDRPIRRPGPGREGAGYLWVELPRRRRLLLRPACRSLGRPLGQGIRPAVGAMLLADARRHRGRRLEPRWLRTAARGRGRINPVLGCGGGAVPGRAPGPRAAGCSYVSFGLDGKRLPA